MSYTLLDADTLSAPLQAELARHVALMELRGITPGIGVILLGDDPLTESQIRNKRHESLRAPPPADAPEDPTDAALRAWAQSLEDIEHTHGLLVRLPVSPDATAPHYPESEVVFFAQSHLL